MCNFQCLQERVETWYREGSEKGRLHDEVAKDAAIEVVLGDGRSHAAKIGEFVVRDGFGDYWLDVVFAEDDLNNIREVEVKGFLCKTMENT